MWALPTDEVERVEVERSEDSGPFLPVTTLEGPATTLVDEDLAPATTYRYRVRVCNEGGCSPFAPEASATTFSALRLTTTTLPSAVVGVAYQASLGATGGNGQLAFSLAGGALPPGISLASDGTLSGTPTAAGTFAFQVRATSADGTELDRGARALRAGRAGDHNQHPSRRGGRPLVQRRDQCRRRGLRVHLVR